MPSLFIRKQRYHFPRDGFVKVMLGCFACTRWSNLQESSRRVRYVDQGERRGGSYVTKNKVQLDSKDKKLINCLPFDVGRYVPARKLQQMRKQ